MNGEGAARGSRPSQAQELLLRATLLHGASAREAWGEWISGLSAAPPDDAASRMFPLVHRRLEGPGAVLDLSVQGPGVDIGRRAASAFQQTRYRNALLFDEAAGSLRALAAQGIETCLLKGAALAVAAYDDPALRPMSDVDILVRPHDLLRAAEVLRRAGWHTPFALDSVEVVEAHAAPFTNETHGSIDIHWRSLDAPEESEGDHSLWAASRPVVFSGAPTRVPAPADLLLHACISGQRFGEDVGCRWVADALTVVSGGGEAVDWDRLEAEARRHRESRAAADALDYLRQVFQAPIPAEVVARLSAVRVGWWESLAARARQEVPERRGPLLATALHIDAYQRRSGGGVLPRGPMGLARSMARTWGLSSAWLVPFHIVGRGSRRLHQMASRGRRS